MCNPCSLRDVSPLRFERGPACTRQLSSLVRTGRPRDALRVRAPELEVPRKSCDQATLVKVSDVREKHRNASGLGFEGDKGARLES